MYYVENCFVRMWESFPQNWQKFCNFQSSDSAAVILPKCLRMFVWLGWERKLNILQILRKNADVQINVWTFQLDQHHQQNQHDLPGDVKSENRGGCFPRISELEKLFDKTDLFFTLAFFLFDSLWPFYWFLFPLSLFSCFCISTFTFIFFTLSPLSPFSFNFISTFTFLLFLYFHFHFSPVFEFPLSLFSCFCIFTFLFLFYFHFHFSPCFY